MELTINSSNVSGWKVLHVSGEIDIATAPDLDKAIEAEQGDLVIDLTSVDFMDSTGLRSLIAAHRSMTAADRRLLVLPGSGPVRRLFEVAGVGDALHLIDGLQELATL